MTDVVMAPFTTEQVTSLNAYQVSNAWHPFTCGGGHTPAQANAGNPGCGGIRLIAAEDGWYCANDLCGYRQAWAWAWMADGSWRTLPTARVRP